MRKRLFIAALVFLLVVVIPVNGSQYDEKWYFGHNSDGVIAFTADGEMRLILETIGSVEFIGRYRLGTSEALVTVTRDHRAEGLSYFTSEMAVPLEGDVDLTLLEAQGMDILAYQHPYIVIKPKGCRFYCEWSQSVWLANLDTGHLEEIAPYVFIGEPQPLGMDSRYLRYAARSAPDVLRWELFERDLTTGEVRQFYRFSNSYPSTLRANPTGEYWFYHYPTIITAGERPESFSFLICADGSVETLEHMPEGIWSEIGWDMVGDAVMQWTQPCDTDCWLELRPVAGGTAQRFALPEPEYAEVVWHIDDDRILVEQDEVFWLLNASGANLRLGMNKEGFGSVLSPDGQWLFTVDDNEALPSTFSLWNLHREQIVLVGFIEEGFSLDLLERGVFIHEFTLGMGDTIGFAKRAQDSLGVTLYRYSDDAVFTLPSDAYYFDVLADGDILLSRYREGIYRLNPDADEERLLLDGVEALQLGPPDNLTYLPY
jgi:hypothetical protein